MNTLCPGIEYYEFTASVTLEGSTGPNKPKRLYVTRVYVARIDLTTRPMFTVGSHTNKADNPADQNQTLIYRTRKALTIEGVIKTLENNKITIPGTNGRSTTLRPVWISNGTFFNRHKIPYPRVLGPVVHRSNALVDVTPALVGGVIAKSERWYSHQARSSSPVFLSHNSPRQTAAALAQTETEVLGGAGLLVSGGQAHTDAFWGSSAGGVFENSVTYSAGPIIARGSGTTPIYYAVYLRGLSPEIDISWSGAAFYLAGQFPSDLQTARNARRFDPPIQQACVYDGGSSRQLWVRRPLRQPQLRFSGVKVPNYLCIWGHVPSK